VLAEQAHGAGPDLLIAIGGKFDQQCLAGLGPELRFFMITSEARVFEFDAADAGAPPAADAVPATGFDGGGVWIRVRASEDPKCVRCWQHRPDVGADAQHPQLCMRCVGNLQLPGEVRRYC